MPTVLNPGAGEEEPLQIRIDDVPADSGTTAVAPQPGGTGTTSEVGVEDLRRQIEQARVERDQAAQREQRAQQERDYAVALAAEAQRRGISTEELANDNAIIGVQGQAESLKDALKAAHEAGEYTKVADINFQLGRLGSRLESLEQRKWALQNHREQFVAQQQQAARQAQQPPRRELPSDPFERSLALGNRGDRVNDFLRKHKEKGYIRPDGTLKDNVVAAHYTARSLGLEAESDAYFDKIEEILGAREQPTQNTQPQRESSASFEERAERVRQFKDRPMAPPMAAAPVTRSNSGLGGSGTTFTMTPHMRRLAAEQLGPGEENALEWFQNYVEGVKSGRMEPIRE